jgi:7tm Odorant receptor
MASIQIAIQFMVLKANSASNTKLFECIFYCGIFLFISIEIGHSVYLYRDEIIEILNDLAKNFPRDHELLKKNQIHKNLNLVKFFTLLIFLTYLLFVFAAIFEVVIRLIIYYINPDEAQRILVTASYYPFDKFQPFVHEILIAYESWYVFFGGYFTVYASIIIVELFELIKIELDVVATKISEVEDEAEFAELVETHNKLMDICNRLAKVFAPLSLINIFFVILILAFLIFIAQTEVSSMLTI